MSNNKIKILKSNPFNNRTIYHINGNIVCEIKTGNERSPEDAAQLGEELVKRYNEYDKLKLLNEQLLSALKGVLNNTNSLGDINLSFYGKVINEIKEAIKLAEQ